MTLLDTNVLIYAFYADSPLCEWASEKIADAVACARVFRRYRERRMTQSGKPIADTPVPDFLIGALPLDPGRPPRDGG